MRYLSLLHRPFVMLCIALLIIMFSASKVKANNIDINGMGGTSSTMMLQSNIDEEDHTVRDVIVAIVFLILFSAVMRAISSDNSGVIVDNIMTWRDKLGNKMNGFKNNNGITYCPHCGEILEGDEKFCVKCGSKISKD